MLSPVFIAFALLSVCRADVTVLSAIGVSPANSMQGEVLGTGPLGTTYALSGVTDGTPFTITLVEGPSNIAETFSLPSATAETFLGCVLGLGGSDSANCAEVIGGHTVGVSPSFPALTLPVSIASGLSSSATSSVTSSSAVSSVTSAVSSTALSSAATSAVPSTTLSLATVASASASQSQSTTASAALPLSVPLGTMLLLFVGLVAAAL